MNEYNLITIYYNDIAPKDKYDEIQEYIGETISNYEKDNNITISLDIYSKILDKFMENADFSNATDEYIINFFENEIKKEMRKD